MLIWFLSNYCFLKNASFFGGAVFLIFLKKNEKMGILNKQMEITGRVYIPSSICIVSLLSKICFFVGGGDKFPKFAKKLKPSRF